MKYKYLNEDAILATIDNSNNPMEGVRILVGGIKDLRAENERLEADLDIDNMKIRQMGAEYERLFNEHARLEAMLRAWHAARGDDESEAAIELWREACRLAEEKTWSG